MGAKVCKIGQGDNENELVEESLPSTPILTPKPRILDFDPRSPTANIVRTPIHVNVLSENHSAVKGEINSSFTESLEDSTIENHIVSIDPRSPTVEFIRTPIVLGKASNQIRNKNLDNVRKQMTDFNSPKNSTNNDHSTDGRKNGNFKQNIGPILLESSPIVKKIENIENRRSYIGLLETNLDNFETSLDTISEKYESEILDSGNKNLPLKENHELLIDPRSPSLEVLRTPIIITKQINLLNISVPTLISEESETNKIASLYEDQCIIDDISKNVNSDTEELKEKVSEKLCRIDNEIEEIIPITVEPLIIFETQDLTNNFDKKVTNLIYEDTCHVVTTPKKSNKPKDENRTPLGVRNNNGPSKTALSRLKVHDKPTLQNDYTVSKIPVFKDNKSKTKMGIQCENTPPICKVTDYKMKKSEWDADNTLII